MKVSRTVWSRGKSEDNIKALPIAINGNSTNIHNKDAGADISLRSDRKTIKNVVLQEIAISL